MRHTGFTPCVCYALSDESHTPHLERGSQGTEAARTHLAFMTGYVTATGKMSFIATFTQRFFVH